MIPGIPVLEEIALAEKAIAALGTIMERIDKVKNPNRLGDFAKLMADADSNERATAIRQFFQDLMQEKNFTPWYAWTQGIDIPKDMLCDLVDLLVAGTTTKQKGGWLGSMFGSDQGDTVKQAWGKVIDAAGQATIPVEEAGQRVKPEQTKVVVTLLTSIIVNCGRCRAYDGMVVETMDLDLLADIGMALLG